MKYVIYAMVIILGVALEVGVFRQFRLHGAIPDLILLAVLYYSARHDSLDSYAIALVGGLFTDVYAGFPIGTAALAYLIIASLTRALYNSLILHEMTWKQAPLLVAGAAIIYYTWVLIYTWLIVHIHWMPETVVASDVPARILPSLFYDLILMYPVMALLTLADGFIASRQKPRVIGS